MSIAVKDLVPSPDTQANSFFSFSNKDGCHDHGSQDIIMKSLHQILRLYLVQYATGCLRHKTKSGLVVNLKYLTLGVVRQSIKFNLDVLLAGGLSVFPPITVVVRRGKHGSRCDNAYQPLSGLLEKTASPGTGLLLTHDH